MGLRAINEFGPKRLVRSKRVSRKLSGKHTKLSFTGNG